jgi:uncharacterized membrane protein YdbT with pleckstrin-like domain
VDTEPDEYVVFHGHPSWRSMLAFYLKALLIALVAGTLAGVASRIADHRVQAPWVVVAVLVVFAWGLVRGLLRRAATTYTITDQRLTVEQGLLSREVHEAALDRVQNVRCRQSLVQRMLGIGTVEFDTAGGAEFEFALSGVEHPRRIARAIDRARHGRHRLA